jgi:serine/threonine protein kinase
MLHLPPEVLRSLNLKMPPGRSRMYKETGVKGKIVDSVICLHRLNSFAVQVEAKSTGSVLFESLTAMRHDRKDKLKQAEACRSSDIYAFGMVFYEILFRKVPFQNEITTVAGQFVLRPSSCL